MAIGIESGSMSGIYKAYKSRVQQIVIEESQRLIESRIRGKDREHFRGILSAVLDVKGIKPMENPVQTTTGKLDGIVTHIGHVPLNPTDKAKSPIQVSEKARVVYRGDGPTRTLGVLARARQLKRAVALVGEPGAVKTTLTAHLAEIEGVDYYKYQVHKKSRTEDLTIEVSQEANGQFRKKVKELYEWLRKGNVVIDIDEANANPEILWILGPVIRGEEWISPIFPEEPPFRLGPNVQLIFTYNPSYFSGREEIDRRIMEDMIVAWVDLPELKDKAAISESFYGVMSEAQTQGEVIEETEGKKAVYVPPVEVPGEIKDIIYSREKIEETLEAFEGVTETLGRVDLFLETLVDYLPSLANRDGAKYNEEILQKARLLDEAISSGGSIGRMLSFLQLEYRQTHPDKTRIKYAFLELRKNFLHFDRHIVFYIVKPRNRTQPFLHLYPNKILKRVRIHRPGWEHSGEAWVIEGHGLEKGSKLGYFDGEYALVDASKTGGPDSLETEWIAHHELAHVNDTAPHRVMPRNIEMFAMLSPLMHSREKKRYIEEDLVSWLTSGENHSYYTQAAKGILNGLVLLKWERDRPLGRPPQIDDRFDKQHMDEVLKIVKAMDEPMLEEYALYIYEHPRYVASGDKGAYKQKVEAGGQGESQEEEGMQGVDGQLEIEVEVVEGGKAPEIEVVIEEGKDKVDSSGLQELSDELERRRQKDLEREQALIKRIQDKIEKELEGTADTYEKMILGGQGESAGIFARLVRSIRARRKTIEQKLASGLEVDPIAHMLKLSKRFIKRIQIFDMQSHAASVMMDFSGSLAPFKKQMGYALRTVGDNFHKLKDVAPDHFFYDLSFYTELPPASMMEMGRMYTEEEWKKRCVAMYEEIGKSGNDLLKAMRAKLGDFVGPHVKAAVRRSKKKTLILFTDGQDDAIKGDKPSAELEAVLKQYHEAGVEVFAIGFGDGAGPVQAFRGKRQHFIRIQADRPYDVAEAIAKIMEARSKGLGSLPDGDLTQYFGIGGDGTSQMDLNELKQKGAYYSVNPPQVVSPAASSLTLDSGSVAGMTNPSITGAIKSLAQSGREGPALDVMVDELAKRMEDEVQGTSVIASGSEAISGHGSIRSSRAFGPRDDIQREIEILRKELLSAINQLGPEKPFIESIGINLLMGEAYAYHGTNSTLLNLSNEAQMALGRLGAKGKGEVEWIMLDLRRGGKAVEETVEETLNALSEGKGLSTGEYEARVLAQVVIERLKMGDMDLIYASRGLDPIQSYEEPAKKLDEAMRFFEMRSDSHYPVAIEGRILTEMSESDRLIFIRRYGSRIAVLNGEEIKGLAKEDQEVFKENWERYQGLDPDHRMALVVRPREGRLKKLEKVGILALEEGKYANIEYVFGVAGYIADVGKTAAKKDGQATQMLRQLLRVLYEGGNIPKDLLEEVSIEKLLAEPRKILFPPIKTVQIEAIESYQRTSRMIDIMA